MAPKSHETRLNAIVRGISTAKAELAQIDGSLANLKGEAETAAQMIVVAQSGAKAEATEKLDPGALPAVSCLGARPAAVPPEAGAEDARIAAKRLPRAADRA